MEDYRPLLTCDPCGGLTRHYYLGPTKWEEKVYRRWDYSVPKNVTYTGNTLRVGLWGCGICGSFRTYGSVSDGQRGGAKKSTEQPILANMLPFDSM